MFTNSAEAAILDAIFDLFGDEGDLWIGFSSTTPGQDGSNVTEPSSGGYSRQQIDADDFAAAVGGAPTTKASDTAVDFGTASGTWLAGANLTHFVIFDVASGGDASNVVLVGELSTAKPVFDGDPVSIPIGGIEISLGVLADFE